MKSILIADDSQRVRHALRQMFEREGWHVCGEAVDGQDAIAKAQQLQPNIVVLDLSMPIMNGLSAGRVLKQITPDARLILFASFSDLLSDDEIRNWGFSAIVSKGEPGRLVTEVQSLPDAA